MIKLGEILKEILEGEEYLGLTTLGDQMLYENYVILGELLNPNNAYPYTKNTKNSWVYKDIMDNIYFVVIEYQPTKNPYFELKTGWFGKNGKPQYDHLPDNVTSRDWDTRSDTVARIFQDEVIPFFLNQNQSKFLIVKPLDIPRYQFAIRLINKFTPLDKIKIIENKPNEIILEKI